MFLNLFHYVILLILIIVQGQPNSCYSFHDSPLIYHLLEADNSPHVLHRGDILLAGLFPVHERLNQHKCDGISLRDGLQSVAAALFAIDRINNSTNMLNFKLGLYATDSCSNIDRAINDTIKMTQMMHTDKDLFEAFVCENNTEPSPNGNLRKEFSKIVGILGAANSDVSAGMAKYLKLFSIPQISYFSTSAALSDSAKYPFFLRSIASNLEVVKATISILKYFDWHYVNILSDSSEYARAFVKSFKVELHNLMKSEDPTCISQEFEVATEDQRNDIDEYLETFRSLYSQKNDNATVVVVFLSRPQIANFFTAMTNYSESVALVERYMWIGSDAWGARQIFEQGDSNKLFLSRSITIAPSVRFMRGFDEFFKGLLTSEEMEFSWMRTLAEENCNCSYRNHSQLIACKMIDTDWCFDKIFGEYEQIPYLYTVVNAVYAYAYALKSLRDERCGDMVNCTISPHSIRGRDLLNKLREVNFTDITGEPFKFINGVDGPPQFTLLTYELETRKRKIGGRYDGRNGLQMNETFESEIRDQFQPSRCSAKCQNLSKIIYHRYPCCWECTPCSDDEIVVQKYRFDPTTRLYLNESHCEDCLAHNKKPNLAQTECIELPVLYLRADSTVGIIIFIVTSLGILLTLGLAILFFLYRETPIMKASGRENLSVLMLGIVMSHISAMILMMRPSEASCAVSYSLPALCTTIIYSAIFTQANRIARIFGGESKKMTFISARAQLMLMLSICAAELSIIGIVFGIFYNRETKLVKKDVQNDGTNFSKMIFCRPFSLKILGFTSVVPILLILLSTYFAIKIRKAPDGFNQARNIGMVTICNLVLTISVTASMISLINKIYDRLPLCIFLMSMAYLSTGILCLPKLYILFVRPEKNTRDRVLSRSRSHSSTTSDPMTTANQNTQHTSVSHSDVSFSLENLNDHQNSETLDENKSETNLNSIEIREANVNLSEKKAKSVSFGDIRYRDEEEISQVNNDRRFTTHT